MTNDDKVCAIIIAFCGICISVFLHEWLAIAGWLLAFLYSFNLK